MHLMMCDVECVRCDDDDVCVMMYDDVCNDVCDDV